MRDRGASIDVIPEEQSDTIHDLRGFGESAAAWLSQVGLSRTF